MRPGTFIRGACAAFLAAGLCGMPASAHAAVYLTPSQAEAQLLPPHDSVRKVVLRPTDADKRRLEAELGYVPRRDRFIWRIAERAGQRVGYLLLDNEIGKHEPITFAVAMDASGAVSNVAICVYRETRGDEVKRVSFMQQFRGKRPGDSVRLGREIAHVSGATISSRSTVTVVNRALALWALQFGSGGTHAGAASE